MGVARGGGKLSSPRNHREQAEGKGVFVPGSAHVLSPVILTTMPEEKMEAEGADGTCPGYYSESRADT